MELDQSADSPAGLAAELIPLLGLEKCGMITAVPQEVSIFVVDPCETTGHACAEIDTGAAKNDSESSGHVFASVIPNALYNGSGT